MSKKKKKAGHITVAGNIPRPGQNGRSTIVLTAPKRFGIDIVDYTNAVRSAENVDYSHRYKLFDLYSDILMDTHLSSSIERRRNAVRSSQISFTRNGKPDEAINAQLNSPWFYRLVTDIIDAKFYGFSLMQFSKDSDGWIDYDLVPRKHVDPVRKLILRHQTDITGTSWDEYPDLLYVGSEDDLGLLAKAAPWVIYKRNTTADWAQFSEVFGMPIQEYIYETDDDESRQRALDDASSAGSLAVFVHSKESELRLVEAGNKTGSAEVYDRLCERCNSELSKLILGNTLTTEAQATGTQALGTVHKKSEDQILKSDQKFILNVLNFDMIDIFATMGINTAGGEFIFTEPKFVDLTAKANILTQLQQSFRLPISDDWLYETFGIDKPQNYEQMKREIEEKAALGATTQILQQDEDDIHDNDNPDDKNKKPQPEPPKKKSFKDRLMSFFGFAPTTQGATSDW